MAETVMSNLRTRGTLAVVGVATFAAGVAFSDAITGTTGSFSGAVTAESVSGSVIAIGNAADQKNKLVCWGTGGVLGVCTTNSAADCGCLVP